MLTTRISKHLLSFTLFCMGFIIYPGSLLAATGLLKNTAAFTLASDTFHHLQRIPRENTCQGSDQSPNLHWIHAPTGTQSFTLIVSDPDTGHGTFYHWIILNIPSSLNHLSADLLQLPTGAVAGKNSFNRLAYNGPCPPKGKVHRYFFTLYALDKIIPLSAGSDAPTILRALESHILGKATLVGLYSQQ